MPTQTLKKVFKILASPSHVLGVKEERCLPRSKRLGRELARSFKNHRRYLDEQLSAVNTSYLLSCAFPNNHPNTFVVEAFFTRTLAWIPCLLLGREFLYIQFLVSHARLL